ncbi:MULTISPECIES: nucleotide exchange factor GrpE [Salegentibacter]|jgi:molecular chaperone GrpE|uniref:Protein GrpE n=1 Tax=Salegentibacter agarivorans TaxID=345907 RepID=A0A1I2JSZ6_9FLAO|nr:MULTISPECIES: nucleotide exchange factor GrpE [Salegentibacter]APS39018.1 molecular chaperone GrpE [Salegentibacter sp. T436]SFF57704.1 molecular chaperone GrpE [Salegentibacter agarivorans]|tara:strand:- start:23 stop:616 length:594 start_codon:yes stop_codon:yes gene_type:complete
MSNKKEDIREEQQDQPVKDQIEDAIDEAIDEVEGEKENEDNNDDSPEFTEEEKLKEDLQKEKDKFLRLFAEFENYKRRTSKERLELFKTANQEVMTAMLPVLDDFDRALKEIGKSGDKNLVQGVELIHNKFKETLNSKGLEAMNVKEGDAFDSEIHEAITQIPAPKDKLKGKIVDVVERGYKLGDRIIRYPKVVTGK